MGTGASSGTIWKLESPECLTSADTGGWGSSTNTTTTPAGSPPSDLVADIRPRIRDLCGRFPTEADSLQKAFASLERDAPPPRRSPSLVHGDFGPANLLWRDGRIVVLDFDRCARGDPAADLGNLFAQLFRMTIRKPEKLRDFPSARATVLETYRRRSRADSTLDPRVAWYERATLLRKVHRLAFSRSRPSDAESMQRREAEAVQLIRRESS